MSWLTSDFWVDARRKGLARRCGDETCESEIFWPNGDNVDYGTVSCIFLYKSILRKLSRLLRPRIFAEHSTAVLLPAGKSTAVKIKVPFTGIAIHFMEKYR